MQGQTQHIDWSSVILTTWLARIKRASLSKLHPERQILPLFAWLLLDLNLQDLQTLLSFIIALSPAVDILLEAEFEDVSIRITFPSERKKRNLGLTTCSSIYFDAKSKICIKTFTALTVWVRQKWSRQQKLTLHILVSNCSDREVCFPKLMKTAQTIEPTNFKDSTDANNQ